MGNKYKSTLSLVWGLGLSLRFKLNFTWVILLKRIRNFINKKGF